jgi:chromosome segregation ATPase
LTEALASLAEQIESLNREAALLSGQITDVQLELGQTDGAAHEARLRLDEAQRVEQQAGLESEAARRQLEWHRTQQDQLKSESEEAASIRQNLIQSQTEIETASVNAQNDVRALSAQLNEMELAEAQGQAAYWGTRVAVVRGPARMRAQDGRRGAGM